MATTSVLMMDSFLSVDGILSHLKENDEDVIRSTLQTLVELTDDSWAQIADHLSLIEALSERSGASYAQLASLLASKVFFHIQSYEDALRHALSAGDLFEIEEQSEYVQKLTEQCIDSYRIYAQAKYEFDHDGSASNEPDPIDLRLIEIVERMLGYCYQVGDFKHAMGIAIELRRTEHVIKSITDSDNVRGMLDHCFNLCETTIQSRTYRAELLNAIIEIYIVQEERNYTNICRCYFYLGKMENISNILWLMIQSESETDHLMAYQVGFDLADYQNESFQRAIFENIPKPPLSQRRNAKKNDLEGNETNTENQNESKPASSNEDGAPDSGGAEAGAAAEAEAESVDSANWPDDLLDRYNKMQSILLGEVLIPLQLQFLFRNNSSDLLILKQVKDAISERNSVLNNGLLMCNALMHTGTTIDQFLRDNLDWMGRAAHWAKFSSVASLGMIHHGHTKASMTILERYLPGSEGGPYQEGGALYALGLIHAGDSSSETCESTRTYLLDRMRQAQNEILQHGSCLGLGLAALGCQNDLYLQAVREILYHDRAVPGEAAGLALGLLLTGANARDRGDESSSSETVLQMKWYEEMLSYAHETQHEKIIRGLVMGIAIMFYNFEQGADRVISTLISDSNQSIRYGGCYTIGLAYACTANNQAIAQLLHLAVSDVSNDVRRAAVTNIGFVLANKPNQVPKVVQLLSNSYNSHVRYGAAAAIGIACAGTGNAHGIKILKKLAIEETVDYVRQAAMISLGMLLQQHNSTETSEIDEIRSKVYMNVIKSKREYTMTILGAIYGLGILDAGGRNSIISLCVDGKQKRMTAIIGMAVFWQYWYWYPLLPFLSLSFAPTMVMALNQDLKMPKMTFKSNAKPSLYGYPEPLKEEELKEKKVLAKATLSTTSKHKARQLKRQKSLAAAATQKKDSEGDTVMQDASSSSSTETNNDETGEMGTENDDPAAAAAASAEKKDGSDEEDDEKKEEEASFKIIQNPSRVTLNERSVMEWNDERYSPVRAHNRLHGIIIVRDQKPSEGEELVETKELGTRGVYGNEPEPPKPFKYLGD